MGDLTLPCASTSRCVQGNPLFCVPSGKMRTEQIRDFPAILGYL